MKESLPGLERATIIQVLDLAKDVHAHAKGMQPCTCFRAKISHPFLLQSEKKEILRRLNQNLKEQSPVVEVESLAPAPAEPCANAQERPSDAAEQPSSNRDRKKWEAAEPFVLPVAQQTFGETCSTINGRWRLKLLCCYHSWNREDLKHCAHPLLVGCSKAMSSAALSILSWMKSGIFLQFKMGQFQKCCLYVASVL